MFSFLVPVMLPTSHGIQNETVFSGAKKQATFDEGITVDLHRKVYHLYRQFIQL